MEIHQPLALSGSGASQAQSQQASALGEEIRKGSECSETKFRETAQSTSSTKFSPKSNRCILVFNDFFFFSLKGNLTNAQNCTEKPGLEIRHFSSLKDRETTAIVGRWKQNIKMLLAGQAHPHGVGQDKHHKPCRACGTLF